MIIARTLESLHQVAEEARKNSVKVSVLQFDFSQQDFTPIKQQLDKIKVGVLINNVGVSHSIPTPFDLETSEMISRIINVNIASVLSITKLCLDQMKPRKQGLIVNMGIFIHNF